MKKNILIIILVLFSTGMIFSNELQGRIHTITTKQSDTNIGDQVVNVIIRTEGTKRVASVPKRKNETITVGYQLSDGEFYKEDGKTKFEKAAQYYEYVRNINSIIDSADGILELENVGYYEGLVKIKKTTSSNDDYYDIEIIPQARKVLIVIEGKGKPKVITFSDKYTLADVDSEVLTGWVEWLKEYKTSQPPKTSEQRSEEEIEQYRRLSQRVYLSLNSPYPYKGLYDEGGEYLSEYLRINFSIKNDNDTLATRLKEKGQEIVEKKTSYMDDFSTSEVPYWLEEYNPSTNNRKIIEEITNLEKNDYKTLLTFGKVVPNVSDIKAGDIVAFNEGDFPETGIVIEKDTEKKIAFIDKNKGYADLYTLEEIKTKANAGEFIVIRMTQTSHFFTQLIEDEIQEVKINIETMKETTQKSNEKHRWIPNTGEYLILDEIKVTINSIFGLENVKNDIPIYLLGAVDRGYLESPSSGDYGNIYKNKANKFELKYKYFDAEQETEKTITTYLERDETTGKYVLTGSKSNEFKINGKGYITIENGEQLSIQIRPVKDKIYPGDDLLLLFKIGETEYTVDPEDYIAVYDKKMLWRANQYISETEARLQNLDWNNAHPWNTNDSTIDWYGINDWLSDEKGGQIPIQGWTRWNDSIEVNGSVAYGWGCNDTIMEFNDELRAQSDAIKKYKEENDKNGEISWDESSIHVYAPSREGDTVDSTTIEDIINDNLWENYIFPNKEILIKRDPILLKNRKMEDFFLTENMEISIPGLSTFWDENNKYEAGVHDKNTSGIDCSGLAGVANGIKEKVSTRYFAGQINKGTDSKPKWEDDPNAKTFAIFKDSWDINPEITDKTPQFIITERDKQRKLLSYAVPGDILVVGGRHVVIIQDLIYEGNNTVITDYSQVTVIHSATYLKGESQKPQYRVRKNTWDNVETDVTTYQLRRHKEGNSK